MWKSSSTSRMEDEKRSKEGKISHISKYQFKLQENGLRDRDFTDNHNRHEVKTPNSRHDGYHRDHSRDHRYSDKRYNDTSTKEDKSGVKYQKRRHNYSDFEGNSDMNFEDKGYSNRKNPEKYKPQTKSHKTDYKTSKRSHHSPQSPQGRYSPHKSSDKVSSYRVYEHHNPTSPSPKTPASERPSPPRKKFSPPPLPPFEPPVTTKVIGDSSSKSKDVKHDKSENLTFSQFYESKRNEGKFKEYGPDPRLAEQLYGNMVVTKFDLVNFPKNPNVDTTLDSPYFTMEVKYDSIYSFNTFFKTPLERMNNYLLSSRPKIEEEWWLKGTLSLMLIGIPRNWGAIEVLSHLVGSHDKITLSLETLSDEWESDSESDDFNVIRIRKTLKNDCKRLGIKKFILLFGDPNVAVNEIPLLYPRSPDGPELGEELEETKKRFIPNEQPDGMGLLVFDSEDYALRFWSILATNLIQAYPSTMRLCPDPSGWRIYSEALSLSFQNELLNTSGQTPKSPHNDTIDLLSVLTTPNTNFTQTSTNISHSYNHRHNIDSPNNKVEVKNPKNTQLMFVCSYIYKQEEANTAAKILSKFGVKCMYHKPSKIMSLQFPDEKTLHSISFGHKIYTSPTGSRVQCCFLKCDGKVIPILKRANVEHLSNSYDKKKNQVFKPSKFRTPSQGIVNIEDLND